MNRFVLFLSFLCVTPHVIADTFDQIGAMDGSGIGPGTRVSQDFQTGLDMWDSIAGDNVTISTATTFSSVEMVLKGWDGFIDPSSITMYQLNFYSSPEQSGNSLIGDIYSADTDPADATVIPQWASEGFLISIPADHTLEQGEHYFGIIASNQWPVFGQVGIKESLIGDGVGGFWANPIGGFGDGTWGMLEYDLAYRFSSEAVSDPCEEELSPCAADVDGNGTVADGDLLSIIGDWGNCGDGTIRPAGDIAPAPLGDCCVNVTDLLAVIAMWGTDLDCTPIGACCFDTGTCTNDMRQQDCEAKGGFFLGEDTDCFFEDCGVGACCLTETECIDNVTAWYCGSVEGEFKGEGSVCQNVACMLEGDECSNAIEVFVGANPFDTTPMTPSPDGPIESGNDGGFSWDCFDTNLDWNNSRDGWYKYIGTEVGPTTFSTCDPKSYDTSIALYAGGCNPNNQVRCNGDSALDDTNCQPFFSTVEYYAEIGEVYYIRIGSWNGESVGQGTLTITPPPTGDGVCCLNSNCFDYEPYSDPAICIAFGGEFYVGETCDNVELCVLPEPPANDHCSGAEELILGQTTFDTTYADAGSMQVDDSQCATTGLNWCYEEDPFWICSPDVWFFYEAPSTGIIRFSTCDPESFDTSIVLYEGGCDDISFQVACNGDAAGQTGCQEFYSSIEYDLLEGVTYYLRVGGWKGATGTGTITVAPVGAGALGACCLLGDCIGDLSEADCQTNAGQWHEEIYCSTVVCEQPECSNAIVSQSPFASSDPNWRARTSADDPTNGYYYESAANVQVNSMSAFTVWGLEAENINNTWQPCGGLDTFRVTTYADDGSGLPGSVLDESTSLAPIRTETGEIFTLNGESYELFKYEFAFVTADYDHISVQSNSAGLDCWFLWMCSPNGDGMSSTNYGDGWFQLDPAYIDDLSICIE